jgi:hypothetical protein
VSPFPITPSERYTQHTHDVARFILDDDDDDDDESASVFSFLFFFSSSSVFETKK